MPIEELPPPPLQMTRARSRTEWRGNCTKTVMTEFLGNDSGLSIRMPPSEMSTTVPPHIFASVPKRTDRRLLMRSFLFLMSTSGVVIGRPSGACAGTCKFSAPRTAAPAMVLPSARPGRPRWGNAPMTRSRNLFPRRLAPAACAALLVVCAACLGEGKKESPPHPKRFFAPLFDGLWLGMTRDEAARAHPIRPALTSAGRTHLVWFYERPGEYAVELTFPASRPEAKLTRIDVHFGANQTTSQSTITAFARTLGEP